MFEVNLYHDKGGTQMIKYFCDLCGEEIHGSKRHDARYVKYGVHVSSALKGAGYEIETCVCPGCASVIMDTISKLRVDEP